jgi:formate dehydrogenase maturation protein FdhE
MRSGEIEANLITLNRSFQLPYIVELIDRKLNGTEAERLRGLEKDFHHQEYLRLTSLLEQAAVESSLPHEAKAGPALNDLLVRVRLKKQGDPTP